MRRTLVASALLIIALCSLANCGRGGQTETYFAWLQLDGNKTLDGRPGGVAAKGIEDYVTTPTAFSGALLALKFHSHWSDHPELSYFPPDCWSLRQPDGINESLRYHGTGTVHFDLTEPTDISQGYAEPPMKTGFGIYHSLFLEYTYLDVAFSFSGKEFEVRICTSSWDGCTRGDLMMRGADGEFGWISRSGDPDTLLSERPADPVYDPGLASWASAWAAGDTTATILVTEAVIPDDSLFDVPDASGSYSVLINYELTNIIVLRGIDPSSHTRRDVLEKISLDFLTGKGDNRLVVRPVVELMQ